MRFALIFLLCWLTAPMAWASGFVVWMEAQVPDVEVLEKADRLTGGTSHLAHQDLAFPPEPVTPADDRAYALVREEITAGEERWDQFEVEHDIAMRLEQAVGAIEIVRDDRDLAEVMEALLLQGAAVGQAYEPDDFEVEERAAPFRRDLGRWVNRPWLDALALDDDGTLIRADLIDGTAYIHYQAMEPGLVHSGLSRMDLTRRPEGMTLFLDGRLVPEGTDAMPLRPGRHYAHAERDGMIYGRAQFDVAPGDVAQVPQRVTARDRDATRARVLAGEATGFAAPVAQALALLRAELGGPVFVGAVDSDGKVMVLPYAEGASLLNDRVFTAVTFGEFGAAVLGSAAFDQAEDGSALWAPAVYGGIGLELSASYFVGALGVDLAIAPSASITYGQVAQDRNEAASVFPHVWGGLGAYVLRPIGETPTVSVLATMGWYAPAHLGVGGRVAVGIPLDDHTWLRMSTGASTFPSSLWDTDESTPLHVFLLRVGLATRL